MKVLVSAFSLCVTTLCAARELPSSRGFLGPIGRKADTFLAERIFSDEARGIIYEEAVHAFRTHDDDDSEHPARKGRARTTPGVRIQYGPLLLAKSLNAGTPGEAIFKDVLEVGCGTGRS